MHLIFCLIVLIENTFLKIGEQLKVVFFNLLQSKKINFHLNLTQAKKMHVCVYPTITAKKYQHLTFFGTICKKL